jgi:hypothetical protein
MAERRRPTGGSKSTGRKRAGSNGSSSGASQSRQGEDRILGAAPSSPDIRKLHLLEPSEAAKAHEPSTVDAMGQDKRRAVVGHSYGPPLRRQIMFFVAVAVVVVVIVGGWLGLVALFDKPPTHFSDQSPWSKRVANPALAAQQSAAPVSPSTPCGEPGNQYPIPSQSPCAPPSKSNDFQGTPSGQ